MVCSQGSRNGICVHILSECRTLSVSEAGIVSLALIFFPSLKSCSPLTVVLRQVHRLCWGFVLPIHFFSHNRQLNSALRTCDRHMGGIAGWRNSPGPSAFVYENPTGKGVQRPRTCSELTCEEQVIPNYC